MTYSIKEMFYTLQGEGANAGRAAVFCRFAGCNLWSGREEDRSEAICKFCDTDFVGTEGQGGGKFRSAAELVDRLLSLWPSRMDVPPFIVFTGGEPMLQIDAELVSACGLAGLIISVETNGTIHPPPGISWLTVSPKAGSELKVKQGNELKLVYPQVGSDPANFENLTFDHFYLQPMDGPDIKSNTEMAVQYCKAHPKWRLSLQTHKILGIP